MSELERSAKGTGWSLVPPHILADENITSTQKLLWGKINALADNKGYCWASNDWFAKSLGKTSRTIKKSISDLVSKGLLEREVITDEDGKVSERRLFPYYPSPGVGEKASPHGEENFTHKNRVISKESNTNNSQSEKYSEDLREDIDEVFEYWRSRRADVLDKEGGPKMKLSRRREKKIAARLKEGYPVQYLKDAVDGMLQSKFHVENGHTDIELVCRNQQKVDMFNSWVDGRGDPNRAEERESRENVSDVQVDLEEWEPDD